MTVSAASDFCLTVSPLGWLINGDKKVHSSECKKRIISVM